MAARLWVGERIILVLFLHVLRQAFGGSDDRNWGYPIAPHRLFVVPPSTSFYEMALPGYDLSNGHVSSSV